MIWLPGVLSQGGGKYVWNKYSNSDKTLLLGQVRNNEYSTYPINGIHIDGYWYVLQNAEFIQYSVSYEELYNNSGGSLVVGTSANSWMYSTAYTRSKLTFTLTKPVNYTLDQLIGISSALSGTPHYSMLSSKTSGTTMYRVKNVSVDESTVRIGRGIYTAKETMGSMIDTITAPADTYPENGIQDGYWYVLQE